MPTGSARPSGSRASRRSGSPELIGDRAVAPGPPALGRVCGDAAHATRRRAPARRGRACARPHREQAGAVAAGVAGVSPGPAPAHAGRGGVLAQRAREQRAGQPEDDADDPAPRRRATRPPPSSTPAAIAWASRTARASGSMSGRPSGCVAEGRLEAALELADGDLLTDLDDDWVLEERHASTATASAAILDALGGAAEESGDVQAAARFARRRLDLEPDVRAGGARAHAAAGALRRRRGGRRGLRGVPCEPAARATAWRRRPRRARSPRSCARRRGRARSSRRRRRCRPRSRAATTRRSSAGTSSSRRCARRGSGRAPGRPHVVMVSGEAGSGKTRLLTELASEVRARGAEVLAGRCMEDGMVAFAPFTEALRHTSGVTPTRFPSGWPPSSRASCPSSERERRTSDPGDVRHRLFEAVAGVIGRSAQRGPVLLVVEDLHWADAATLQMLAHVIRTVGVGAAARRRLPARRGRRGDRGPACAARRPAPRAAPRARAAGGLSEAEAGDLAAAWLGAGPPPSWSRPSTGARAATRSSSRSSCATWSSRIAPSRRTC